MPHAAWNAGDDEVHVLARDGRTTSAGVPRDPLRLAVVLREFEDEIVFIRPPAVVQRAILRPLAAIGRLLGYRAEYPYRRAERGVAA